MKIVHFASAEDFRRWLAVNHSVATELWVGFYRKDSGRGGLTYPEALDEALCFGWIDGIRRKVDARSYTNRFTPRQPGSIWSRLNVTHVERLTAAGRMHAAGLAAFAARTADKTARYSFEQRPQRFPRQFDEIFRANRRAWEFWQRQPPGYRRLTIWWVISAKQLETRRRRLARLMQLSAAGRRLA